MKNISRITFRNDTGEVRALLTPVTFKNFSELFQTEIAMMQGAGPTDRHGRYVQFLTRTGVKVDLFMATPDNWGYIFAIRTGSAEFSQSLAWRWKKMGYEGQDGMLTRFGKPVPLKEERDLFNLIQLPWVQPQDR